MNKFKRIDIITGWVVFAIASLSYILTIEPTASFWDCGEFITTAFRLEPGHPPGAPFFMIMGRFFSLFSFDAEHVSVMINIMSALASGFTILFLYWTITHIARRIIVGDYISDISVSDTITVIGCGVVGALCYAFSDTFWFSAVEGEVYAMSSLFTAVVFWCILKWESCADEKYSNRWLILICYLMGLSIGVHLLNLLTVPAIVFVYWYKKYTPSVKGAILTLVFSVVLLAGILYGIIPGVVWVASLFELWFTNLMGFPFNTGTIVYALLGISALVFGIYYSQKYNHPVLNALLLGVTVIIIGYSSFAMIVIRSAANPPMDENNPDNVFALQSYLNREQYGDRPLFSGEYYNSEVIDNQETGVVYAQRKHIDPKDSTKVEYKYEVVDKRTKPVYDESQTTLFPRMYSPDPNHIKGYAYWAAIPQEDIKNNIKPTFSQNMRFFFNYQIGYMYLRYFMWNFAGRQNDIQGQDNNVMNGNWISGIPFIDNTRLGDQSKMPQYLKDNKANNRYFMLPFILGILGMIYMYRSNIVGKQYFKIVLLFFLLTGPAIIIYLNQTPYQPRERDYGYAGSFFAFAIYVGMGVALIRGLFNEFIKNKIAVASISAVIGILAAPVLLASQNWDDHDRSYRKTARDFARNYLESCAPNAILFTNGDNDTFPLWYAQEVEGIRTDVRVVNLAYLNTDWYINQMMRKAYKSEPLPIMLNGKPLDKSKFSEGTRDVVYIKNQPSMFLNEKFNAERYRFKPALDTIYNNLMFVLQNSTFATQHPEDYQTISKSVPSLSTMSQLIKIIASDADKYNINRQYISDLKNQTDKLVMSVSKGYVPLQTILPFIFDDSENTKIVNNTGEQFDYVPCSEFMLNVDVKKVLANGTVPEKDRNKIVPALKWSHPTGFIRKAELIVLDILASNNWERPVYFAITVGSDAYQGLDKYFRLEGMTYRLVPVAQKVENDERGYVNTDILYDNVMNKFVWGGVNNPKVYLDENNQRMLLNVKSTFSRLADALAAENKKDSVLNVFKKCTEILPPSIVPPSYYDIFFASVLYKIGDKDDARALINNLAQQTLKELNYFGSLDPYEFSTVDNDDYRSCAITREITRVLRENKDSEYNKKWTELFVNALQSRTLLSGIMPQSVESDQFYKWFMALNDNDKQRVQFYLFLIRE